MIWQGIWATLINVHTYNLCSGPYTCVFLLTFPLRMLPELLGGEDAGGGDRVVADDAVVRVVRVTYGNIYIYIGLYGHCTPEGTITNCTLLSYSIV